MGAAVGAGRLSLEQGVARRCAARCAEFVDQLRRIQFDASKQAKVDGFGTLQSGIDLAAKFGKKASGGDYSMVQAIDDHITVVLEMQQTFEKIEAMYSASEDRGTAGINSAGSPL
ncbi:hypothetical protein [Rhodococcus sp. PvR099]|uniref:hypothetical protein n=1 Tax=Rhodococcus sp. PvR099 TaxID=2806602 RepID=UPI001AE8D83B|nr:hypothetical protein [Rhodococcus sp. PvR099]MBP1159774.1 hypothetical protein [Rhodococcus sp. PvR099]